VLSADRVAADEIVQPDSEHSGNELEKTKSPRVSSASKIGRQGLGALGGGTTSPVISESQSKRQAFFVLAPCDLACERLTRQDDGKYTPFGVSALERFDLSIRPTRFRSGGRA